MKYLLKCFFLLLILAIVGCPYQSEEICFEEYQINIPITLFPQIDTFKLGDTIWIESLLSHALVDLNHDSLLNISNFSTNTRVGIFRFDTIAPAIAFDYFQYLNEVGEFQVFTRFIKVSYDITENQRAFKVGLIPIKAGGVYITFYNLTDDVYNIDLTNSKCIQNIDINYKMNDGNMNLHFITESSNVDNVTTEEEALKSGIYAFWVIE